MPYFRYTVKIKCATPEQADSVMDAMVESLGKNEVVCDQVSYEQTQSYQMDPADVLETIMPFMQETYDLFYLPHGAELPQPVKFKIANGSNFDFDEQFDWVYDNLRENAQYELDQLTEGLSFDKDDWKFSDEYDEAIQEILNRDRSDPIDQLAGNSGYMMMRVPVIEEGDWTPEVDQENNRISNLGELIELLGLEIAEADRQNVEELLAILIANVPSDFFGFHWLFTVSLSDLYEIKHGDGEGPWGGNTAKVTVDRAWLMGGNHLMGATWAEGPFENVTVGQVKDLRSDTSYYVSWRSTAGDDGSAYQTEIHIEEKEQ